MMQEATYRPGPVPSRFVVPATTSRLGAARVAGFFSAYGQRRVIMIAVALLALSIPSISGVSFSVQLPLLSGDLRVFQAVVLVAAVLGLAARGRIPRVPVVVNLTALAFVVIALNALTALVSDPRMIGPLLRGIASYVLNLLIAVCACLLMEDRERAIVAAKGILLFSVVLALSAVFEYVLLKTSAGALVVWRSFVWGSVDPNDVLHAGGVTLDSAGLARVGGLIGAPENVGLALGLTLPVLLFLGPPPAVMGSILGVFALAAVVTGSRTLTIALALFAAMTLRPRRFRKGRQRALILSAVVGLVLLGAIGSSVNEDARDRFSLDNLRYEAQWRGDRLMNLLDATGRQRYGWLTGLGFGSGADQYYGLDSVTSGVLGGDVAIAYGLGGAYGLVVLGGLWTILLSVRRRGRGQPGTSDAAVDTYIALVGGMSLLTPMLMQLILSTSTISALIVGSLVLLDAGRTTAAAVPREAGVSMNGPRA